MLKAGVAITGAALLFACGDDSSSGAEGSQTATGVDSTVESIDDLLDCTSKHEGETVFVKEDEEIYVCTDGDWVVAGESGDGDDDDGDDADKKSSSSTAKSADSKAKSSSSEGGDDASSSSVIPGSDPESSSSDGNDDGKSSSSSKAKSSSSDGNDDGKSSSSSKAKSSSSVESSSSVIASSSSEELVSSSSFNKSSSSSRGFFDMTKDEFLNPKISYGEMTDTRDNKTYKTVKIDDQVWMAENLNYADSTKTPSLKGKSWCYDNKAENCDVAGRLYTWAVAIDSVALANDADNPQTCGYGVECTLPTVVQGVCPEGWHLPSNDEWQTLFTAVGGSSKAGTALKSQTGWKSQTGDAADRDAYGFSALPAGLRYYNGYFFSAGNLAFFWSASEDDSDYAYGMYLDYDLDYDYEDAGVDSYDKSYGFSVRCLQN